jgi:GntR family transcriptional regulator
MTLTISIHAGSNVAIYRQIVEQVCAAAAAGRISDEEPLPGVRTLAEQLLINPNTVARAYSELAREGVIESRPGRGMFISRRRHIYSKGERVRRIQQAVASLLAEAFMLGFTAEEIVEHVAAKARELPPSPSARPTGRGESR